MRLLFVQYGDYKEAFERLQNKLPETYYAQDYTVNWVGDLAKNEDYVGVICVNSIPYPTTQVSNQVHCTGFSLKENGTKDIINSIINQKPTHIICRSPIRPVLKWALKNNIKTLPLFADSFNETTFRSKIRYYLLSNLLNHSHFNWISNHNMNACLSLKKIGVMPEKIIPWDYPALANPDDFSIKSLKKTKNISLIYVGALTPAKGIGDCIESLEHLLDRQYIPKLTVVGAGDMELFQKKTKDLKLENYVRFLGKVPHEQVISLMHENDVVVIPSRPEFPEGLPMTIYEAYCSHTPIVASNHPMFRDKILHKHSGMIFEAGNAKDLSEQVLELIQNPDMYHQISTNAKGAWSRLQWPIKWDEVIRRWLRNSHEDAK